MATTALAVLHALAEGRDGLVTRPEALAAGVSRSQLSRLVSAGLVEIVHRGVLRLPAAPRTWHQELRAALFAAGDQAVASHRAAARFFELEGSDRWPVELTIPAPRRVRGLEAAVHRSGDLEVGDVTQRRGLRVTTPTRTLVDLGASVSSVAVEIALDDALRRRLTTVPKLREGVDRLSCRGRRGPSVLRDLLHERGELDGMTDTGFETIVRRILRDAGLPSPTAQHVVRDDQGRFVMRLDLAYPDVRVGIEADSERWHTDRRRFHDDRTKRATAESLGWTVLAFTHRHATRQPEFIARTVHRTLAGRGLVLPTRRGG